MPGPAWESLGKGPGPPGFVQGSSSLEVAKPRALWAIADSASSALCLRRGCTRRYVLLVSTRSYGRCGTSGDSLTSRSVNAPVSYRHSRPDVVRTRVNCMLDHADGRSPTLPYGHICAPCDARWHPAPAVSSRKASTLECSWIRNVTHTRPQGVVTTAPVTAPAPELGTVWGNVTGNVGGNVTPEKISDHRLTACSTMLHYL